MMTPISALDVIAEPMPIEVVKEFPILTVLLVVVLLAVAVFVIVFTVAKKNKKSADRKNSDNETKS